MKVFLDANILVTVLNKEYPVFPYAAKLLSLADNAVLNYTHRPSAWPLHFILRRRNRAGLER
jgi:hypothetical protein